MDESLVRSTAVQISVTVTEPKHRLIAPAWSQFRRVFVAMIATEEVQT